MKTNIPFLLLVCFIILTTKGFCSRALNTSDSPVFMLPEVQIAQGISKNIINTLKRHYNDKYTIKIPEELQREILDNSELKFIINSDLDKVSSIISYDSDADIMVRSILDYTSSQVRTIIILKIDSKGDDIIIFKAKAVNVLSNLIISEKEISFSVSEIDNIDEKIHLLAKKLINGNRVIEFGIGFGFQGSSHVGLDNIQSDIRKGLPHPDDTYRSDILDTNNPDNYFIYQNSTDINLPYRINLDLNFRFWGILNIGIKSSAIINSEVIENENLFRKSYVLENSSGGDALIYYLVRSKNRSFFEGKSFSLPIYFTYPIYSFKKNKKLVLSLVAGTNLLLPEKISFEAEKGWHRFNEFEKESTIDLGDLSEVQFWGGLNLEGAFIKSTKLGLQFTLINTQYQQDFNSPISIQQSNKILPSFRLRLSRIIALK